MSESYGFDLLCLRRFWHIHLIIFPRVLSRNFGLFMLLLCFALIEQLLVYRVGLISGMFYKVLGEKDPVGFKTATLQSLGLILAMTLVKSLRVFVTRTLTVGWRKSLNLALHKMYFAGIKYYQLNVLDPSLDNPDQRMTSDINVLCTKYGSIVTDLLLAPLLISYYSYSAFSRSGAVGPVAMFALFLLSTFINKLLMSPIVNLTVEQERREGDFRFKHMSVRINSEALAFAGSASVEAAKADFKLHSLCKVQQQVVNRQLPLDLATNSFDYLGSIASFLVIAVPIFSGAFDHLDAAALAQVISENAFVCMYLVYQFSKLVDMSSTIVSMAGVTHRIMELAECMEEMDEKEEDKENDNITLNGNDNDDGNDKEEDDSVVYSIKKLTVVAPNASVPLISDLTLEFRLNTNVLIMGRSSAGKSSILRVLRGLWDPLTGKAVKRNIDVDVIFLPQKPFFTDGSLREQIMYPLAPPEFQLPNVTAGHDRWILEMLKELGLEDLVRRGRAGSAGDVATNGVGIGVGNGVGVGAGASVGVVADVDAVVAGSAAVTATATSLVTGATVAGLDQILDIDALSPGEMQRLAFMRLLFHKPKMAFLDEATSALSADVEELLYKKCAEYGITLVSVGHREDLKKFHDKLLRIGLEDEGSGNWVIEDIR